MRICDRCGQQRAQKANERIYAESEGMEIDLCSACYAEVIEFATSIPKRKNKKTVVNRKTQLEMDVH